MQAGRMTADRQNPRSLTPTESKIARLAAGGLSNPQIATRLEISARTVQTHMRAVFRKLRITTRAELVLLVTRLDQAGDVE